MRMASMRDSETFEQTVQRKERDRMLKPVMISINTYHLPCAEGSALQCCSFVMASRLFQNCRSENCVVCGSRIDSIVLRIDSIVTRINSIVTRIDSIVIKIDSIEKTDSIVLRIDWIVSTIDSVKKTASMQNHRLDCVLRSTLILPCLSQSFNNRVDPSTIESILQQSSRWFCIEAVFLTESIVLTIESNVAQIESIFITIESILSTIESVFSIESVYHNRVDSCHILSTSRFFQSSRFLSQSSRF